MSDLVGRDRELGALALWLDDTDGGRGTVVLVHGEPGIGKTRFLEEAAARATARGFAVAWGRAWEVGSAPPYWPWIEALRGLFARPGGRDDAAARLCELLPELDRRPRPAQLVDDPFQLYDALVAYLEAASAREPCAIMLDDLHAADPSSVRLAELLAPQLRRLRACVFASFRDVEARFSPVHDAALARIGRFGESLALQRLAVEDVRVLVQRTTHLADAETARMIFEASDGNPLFVRELLKLLAARGATAGDVPAGVRAVIRERLALLSPAAVALLQAAAVVGRTFSLVIAAEVAGVTAVALEEAIGEAITAELVVPADAGRFKFAHALVAETLAHELAMPVRARLHRRTAEALERIHAGDPHAPLADIAHHWLEVGVEAAGRAADAAERAARGAEQRLAFADAAQLYERALGALAIAEPGGTRRRAELLLQQGRAFVRDGDRARAHAPCLAATEIARSLGDGELVAHVALAFGADVALAQIDRALVQMLEDALALLPAGDSPSRARVMARLAAARQPAPDTREPVALAHEAIAMARRLGKDVLGDVLFFAASALVDFERPEVRARIDEETAQLADGAGDRPRRLRCLQRLAFDLFELGDVDGFDATVTHYEAVAAAAGTPRFGATPLLFRALRAQLDGRLAESDDLAEQGFAIRERWSDASLAYARPLRRAMIAGLHDATRFDELGRMLEPLGYVPAFQHGMRGWIAARRGDLECARAELAWLMANHDEYLSYHALGMWSDMTWVTRDKDAAARLWPRLLVEEGRPVLISSLGFIVTGHIDHDRFRVAAVLERWDDVEPLAAAALAWCERWGAAPLQARIRADLAAALVMRGDPTLHDRARTLIAQARVSATALGLADVERICDRVDRERTGTPAAPPPSPRATERITLQREGEYWTVRGCGESCHIKDSRGIQMLAKLIEHAGRELHALELVAADVVDGGDSGELLDRDARAAYQERLRELRRDRDEADAWNDANRRERLDEEIEALTAELANAYGLGGRERRAGSAAERARQNVRRRLADAMRRIGDASPAIGRHLDITVRTGMSCLYDPDR